MNRAAHHVAKWVWLLAVAVGGPVRAQEAPPEPPAADAPPEATEGNPDFGADTAEAPAAAEPEEGKTQLDEAIDLTLEDRIKAVSRKTFMKRGRFELQPSVMFTTNDAFFRSWFLAGRAAYHINDAFALEVGGGYVPPIFIEQLPPVDVLRERASLINAGAKLVGLADVGVTFSPIYGKVAVLSDQIIHFDAFVIGGGGVILDTNKSLVHPTMDIGVGARVFIFKWLVARADLRDYIYPQDKFGISTLQNVMLLSLGVGFYFPLDFTYQYEAAKVMR